MPIGPKAAIALDYFLPLVFHWHPLKGISWQGVLGTEIVKSLVSGIKEKADKMKIAVG